MPETTVNELLEMMKGYAKRYGYAFVTLVLEHDQSGYITKEIDPPLINLSILRFDSIPDLIDKLK